MLGDRKGLEQQHKDIAIAVLFRDSDGMHMGQTNGSRHKTARRAT